MASMNSITIMGNLTRDPELIELSSGTKLCKLGLASSRKFKETEEVCFVDVAVFGNQAESTAKYLEKGSLVLIEGRLKLDTWEKDGKKNSKHSIIASNVVFLPKQPVGDKSATDKSATDKSATDKSGTDNPSANKPGHIWASN